MSKCKYKFKNEKLEKAILALFDKDSVEKNIAEQMSDGSSYIIFENESISTSSTPLIAEIWEISDLQTYISFPKTEIEVIHEYDSEGWNPFPEVEPPEDDWYLVQINHDDFPHFDILYYFGGGSWDRKCVEAYRKLPERYKKNV